MKNWLVLVSFLCTVITVTLTFVPKYYGIAEDKETIKYDKDKPLSMQPKITPDAKQLMETAVVKVFTPPGLPMVRCIVYVEFTYSDMECLIIEE